MKRLKVLAKKQGFVLKRCVYDPRKQTQIISEAIDKALQQRPKPPETREDVTRFHINGAKYILEIAQIVGARRAYLKGGSPSCDREGVTGELLKRAGIKVVRVP